MELNLGLYLDVYVYVSKGAPELRLFKNISDQTTVHNNCDRNRHVIIIHNYH
jgi:hypothetical protein